MLLIQQRFHNYSIAYTTLCRNLCSLRWLKSTRNLVKSFIPFALCICICYLHFDNIILHWNCWIQKSRKTTGLNQSLCTQSLHIFQRELPLNFSVTAIARGHFKGKIPKKWAYYDFLLQNQVQIRGLEMDYFDDLKPTKISKKPLDCLTSFERFEIETNDFIKTLFFINTSNGF